MFAGLAPQAERQTDLLRRPSEIIANSKLHAVVGISAGMAPFPGLEQLVFYKIWNFFSGRFSRRVAERRPIINLK